ncbi:AI-2E family transporter [Peptoniphilus lacrimalis]|uniref:ATP synthase F0, A subunit n=1 Tax=Peptoniphilus lacrimalis 315-B TaxID=596330 RepID=D1VRT9_9FIRM|nr:AI-2E family transporter [Peptoniphilus lacrimalis]EFA90734.1 hypothetical protein HMPREF0628_1182 [Peptoniphilus lacrimalis 315-B]
MIINKDDKDKDLEIEEKKLHLSEGKIRFSNDVYRNIFLVLLGFSTVCYLFLNQKGISKIFVTLLSIMFPFILGGVLAFMIKIVLNFFEEKLFNKIKSARFQKHKRKISILVSIFVIFLIIFIILRIVVPQFISSISKLQTALPPLIQKAIDKSRNIAFIDEYSDKMQKIYDHLSVSKIFDQIREFVKNQGDNSSISTAFQRAYSTATNILGGIVNFVLALITAIYILSDKEHLEYQSKRIVYSIFSQKTSGKIFHVFKLLHQNFERFIRGQIIDSTVLGIIVFIFSFLAKMPNATTLGVLAGVTNLVPIIGPFIGGFMGFVLIVIDDFSKAIIFVIFIFIMQQVESNLIYPKLVGGAVGLPALWTLIAITVGGSLFGVVGMWVFIPLTSTIYTLIGEYTKYKIDKKDIDLRMRKV